MKAYHGDKTLKTKCIGVMRGHREAERLVQAHGYWENGKGCAVGCVLHDLAPGHESDHARYETLIGVPQALARLEDCIFEGLPKGKALQWPERFFRSINPGADLSGISDKLALEILINPEHGVILHAGENTDVEKCILGCAELYGRKISGDNPSAAEWMTIASESASALVLASARALASASESARALASASESVLASASESFSAMAMARASARAWAWASESESAMAMARARHWEWIADTLIGLIKKQK